MTFTRFIDLDASDGTNICGLNYLRTMTRMKKMSPVFDYEYNYTSMHGGNTLSHTHLKLSTIKHRCVHNGHFLDG